MPELRTPAECPVCGESVPRGARACPHCGADERSGWDEEETRYDGIDLPDGSFEPNPASSRVKPSRVRSALLGATAVLLALSLLWLLL